ncbi:MAG: transposase [Polyangiaceae bacterium]
MRSASAPLNVESYLGWCPARTARGKRRIGAITKKGNKYLRALLVQAAWCVKTRAPNDPLRLWVHEVAQRRGRRVAVIALARRLVGILWAMWRDGTVYDPEHLARASSRGTHRAARSAELRAKALAAAAKKLSKKAPTKTREVTPVA